LLVFGSLPIRYLAVDFENALAIAHAHSLYAYDAYFIECASRQAAPLLTLDRALIRAAERIGLHVLKV
jgi:predicted nucleic acid-binding protein